MLATISIAITLENISFSEKVMRADIIHRARAEKGLTRIVSLEALEIGALSVHPNIIGVEKHKAVMKRSKLFSAESLANDDIVFECVIRYGIYLDPLVITGYEHKLWTLSKTGLRLVCKEYGSPISFGLHVSLSDTSILPRIGSNSFVI
jgi:hypothetical protein